MTVPRLDVGQASVSTALEMVREELAELVEATRRQGAEAYASGDHRAFQRLDQQREGLESFQGRFDQVLQDWRRLEGGRTRRRARRKAGEARARRGELLPERDYVLPILRALKGAGGAGRVRDILAAVERSLGANLKPKDREPLQRGQIRWENRAQWVRKDMVDAGLLSANSAPGTWEITPQGLRELERGDLDRTWERIRSAEESRRRG